MENQEYNEVEIFAKRLREIRLEHGLTQEGLAEIMGVNAMTIHRYENGTNKTIKKSILVQLSDIFSIDKEWLIGITQYKNFDHFKEMLNKLDRIHYLYEVMYIIYGVDNYKKANNMINYNIEGYSLLYNVLDIENNAYYNEILKILPMFKEEIELSTNINDRMNNISENIAIKNDIKLSNAWNELLKLSQDYQTIVNSINEINKVYLKYNSVSLCEKHKDVIKHGYNVEIEKKDLIQLVEKYYSCNFEDRKFIFNLMDRLNK